MSDSDYSYIKNKGKTTFLTVIIPECWVEMIFICFRMLFSFPIFYSEHNLDLDNPKNMYYTKDEKCPSSEKSVVFLSKKNTCLLTLPNCHGFPPLELFVSNSGRQLLSYSHVYVLSFVPSCFLLLSKMFMYTVIELKEFQPAYKDNRKSLPLLFSL